MSGQAARDEGAGEKIRLDKWLWFARFFKTRALAADAIDGGRVEVNGQGVKRAKSIASGDRIRIRQGAFEWNVEVTGLAARRGSAEVASGLYQESDESRQARALTSERLRGMNVAFAHGDSKPGKRDRRALRRLKGDE